MLEKYIPDFIENEFIRKMQKEHGIATVSMTRTLILREEPKEGYYQKKIMDAVKARWPEAYVQKIAQGAYSTAGIPDIMVVLHGRYYGLEVKRPVGGRLSKLQELSILQIRRAGGMADVCHWPEEAIALIENGDKANS